MDIIILCSSNNRTSHSILVKTEKPLLFDDDDDDDNIQNKTLLSFISVPFAKMKMTSSNSFLIVKPSFAGFSFT